MKTAIISTKSTFPPFTPPPRREPCELYLISPQDVGGDFPDLLKAALSAGPVAAFQLRVKGIDEHAAGAARRTAAADLRRRRHRLHRQ